MVLSPFVVTAEDDQGYQATNTLAGTRLRSSLKDVASPISVFTAELLKDIGATNFQEAMLYSVNVENENEFARDDTEGESIASTTQTRVRGLAASSQTRGFFRTNFRADTYNTERITVASGPNSILFGIGSPAGIIDTTPSVANLARKQGSISARTDNWGSYRGVIDFSVPIFKDVLAIRAAKLEQKNKTFRTPEYDDESREYFALSFRPHPNTTIRANYERLEDDRVRARDTLMQDNVTDWVALGKPLYDRTTDKWSVDNGVTWTTRSDLGNGWKNTGGIGYRDRVFMAGGSKGDSSTQGLVWGTTTALVGSYATALSYDRFKLPVKSFANDDLVSSEINYYGLGDQTRLSGESYSVVVEQKIMNNFYAEFAYNREKNTRDQDDPLRGGLSTIQADVNWYLPAPVTATGVQIAGAPVRNPNVGRYFIDSEYLGWTQDLDFETMRGMLSYTLDFADRRLKWLGRHNFGAMVQKETTDDFKVKRRLTNTGTYWIGAANNISDNNIKSRYYLNLPGFGGDSAGVEYPGRFVSPTWPTVIGSIQEGPTKTKAEVVGKLLMAQSYFLKDDLVLTFGYRKDTQKSWAASFGKRDPVTYQIITDGVGLNATPVVQEGITRTIGAVYHTPLKGLSLIYSRSNAFNPQGNYRDWFNNPLPPGSGEGQDIGIQLDLLDNKLSARLSRFTNDSIDNVEFDWYYEEPKWGVVGNLDESWGNITAYARRLGNTSDINIATVNDTVRATRDYSSEGYEMELFYRPTNQLDLRFTLAQTKATNLSVVPLLQEYIDFRLPVWEKYFGYPAWSAGAAVLPAFDPNWKTNPNSIGYMVLNGTGALPRVEEFKASEGSVTTRGRKWRANFIGNYRFAGKLAGFSAGGAGRWRTADTIGYDGMPNPLLAGGREIPDVSRPIKGEAILQFDGWLAYQRTVSIGDSKYNWGVQLNIRNVLNDDDIVPLAADVTRVVTSYSRNEPRTFILSTNLGF